MQGRVSGFYTIFGDDGRQRRVNYEADENGYRATVLTNEIGVLPVQSADAEFVVAPPSQGQLRAANATSEEYARITSTLLDSLRKSPSDSSPEKDSAQLQAELAAGSQGDRQRQARVFRQQANANQALFDFASGAQQQPKSDQPTLAAAAAVRQSASRQSNADEPTKTSSPAKPSFQPFGATVIGQQMRQQFLAQAVPLDAQDYQRKEPQQLLQQQQQQQAPVKVFEPKVESAPVNYEVLVGDEQPALAIALPPSFQQGPEPLQLQQASNQSGFAWMKLNDADAMTQQQMVELGDFLQQQVQAEVGLQQQEKAALANGTPQTVEQSSDSQTTRSKLAGSDAKAASVGESQKPTTSGERIFVNVASENEKVELIDARDELPSSTAQSEPASTQDATTTFPPQTTTTSTTTTTVRPTTAQTTTTSKEAPSTTTAESATSATTTRASTVATAEVASSAATAPPPPSSAITVSGLAASTGADSGLSFASKRKSAEASGEQLLNSIASLRALTQASKGAASAPGGRAFGKDWSRLSAATQQQALGGDASAAKSDSPLDKTWPWQSSWQPTISAGETASTPQRGESEGGATSAAPVQRPTTTTAAAPAQATSGEPVRATVVGVATKSKAQKAAKFSWKAQQSGARPAKATATANATATEQRVAQVAVASSNNARVATSSRSARSSARLNAQAVDVDAGFVFGARLTSPSSKRSS